MDFVRHKKSGREYLVTEIEKGKLELWDFGAWLEGYYDAYISISEVDVSEYEVIGSFETTPQLLPKECEGYNGEPHIECLEQIYP